MSTGSRPRFLAFWAFAVILIFPFCTCALADVTRVEISEQSEPKLTKGLLQTSSALKCDYTPLLVDTMAWEERCKPNNGPCFGIARFHWNQQSYLLTGKPKGYWFTGYLRHAHFKPWLEPLNMTNEVIVRDGNALWFALRNSATAFELTLVDVPGLSIRYSDYDPSTNCYNIAFNGPDNTSWRLVAQKPEAKWNYFEVDTWKRDRPEKQVCGDRLIFYFGPEHAFGDHQLDL